MSNVFGYHEGFSPPTVAISLREDAPGSLAINRASSHPASSPSRPRPSIPPQPRPHIRPVSITDVPNRPSSPSNTRPPSDRPVVHYAAPISPTRSPNLGYAPPPAAHPGRVQATNNQAKQAPSGAPRTTFIRASSPSTHGLTRTRSGAGRRPLRDTSTNDAAVALLMRTGGPVSRPPDEYRSPDRRLGGLRGGPVDAAGRYAAPITAAAAVPAAAATGGAVSGFSRPSNGATRVAPHASAHQWSPNRRDTDTTSPRGARVVHQRVPSAAPQGTTLFERWCGGLTALREGDPGSGCDGTRTRHARGGGLFSHLLGCGAAGVDGTDAAGRLLGGGVPVREVGRALVSSGVKVSAYGRDAPLLPPHVWSDGLDALGAAKAGGAQRAETTAALLRVMGAEPPKGFAETSGAYVAATGVASGSALVVPGALLAASGWDGWADDGAAAHGDDGAHPRGASPSGRASAPGKGWGADMQPPHEGRGGVAAAEVVATPAAWRPLGFGAGVAGHLDDAGMALDASYVERLGATGYASLRVPDPTVAAVDVLGVAPGGAGGAAGHVLDSRAVGSRGRRTRSEQRDGVVDVDALLPRAMRVRVIKASRAADAAADAATDAAVAGDDLRRSSVGALLRDLGMSGGDGDADALARLDAAVAAAKRAAAANELALMREGLWGVRAAAASVDGMNDDEYDDDDDDDGESDDGAFPTARSGRRAARRPTTPAPSGPVAELVGLEFGGGGGGAPHGVLRDARTVTFAARDPRGVGGLPLAMAVRGDDGLIVRPQSSVLGGALSKRTSLDVSRHMQADVDILSPVLATRGLCDAAPSLHTAALAPLPAPLGADGRTRPRVGAERGASSLMVGGWDEGAGVLALQGPDVDVPGGALAAKYSRAAEAAKRSVAVAHARERQREAAAPPRATPAAGAAAAPSAPSAPKAIATDEDAVGARESYRGVAPQRPKSKLGA